MTNQAENLREEIAKALFNKLFENADYINWILDGDVIGWSLGNDKVHKIPREWANQILSLVKKYLLEIKVKDDHRT